MQPVALQSLSELERASLQELALFRLQERLPGGPLSPDRGTGDRVEGGRTGDRRLLQGGLRLGQWCCSPPAPQPRMEVMGRCL